MTPFYVDSIEHHSWHEAGHALAAHLWGATVRFIEVGVSNGRYQARTRIEKTSLDQGPFIACGGFACECIHHEGKNIVLPNGTPLSDEELAEAVRDSTHLDKRSFFGKNYSDLNDVWPDPLERVFKQFTIHVVAPRLRTEWARTARLARAIRDKKSLGESEIADLLR